MNVVTSENSSLYTQLKKICPEDVFVGVDLAKISRWRVGGLADCIVRPRSAADIRAVIRVLSECNKPFVVIGSTSNLLFSDRGVRAVIIQIGSEMSQVMLNGNIFSCYAGVWVPGLAKYISKKGFSGIEHICGIPGTLGGLVCMNGGSQRKGIGDHVLSVLVVTPEGELKRYNKQECAFAYRSSVFQSNKCIVVEVELKFPEGCRDTYSNIRKRLLAILRDRRSKFPQKQPNCGSVFVSNPAMYDDYGSPGVLIEKLGFKGMTIGGAKVSDCHANFIINNGDAKACDVVALISKIRSAVDDETGYQMQPEARYVDEMGRFLLPLDSEVF